MQKRLGMFAHLLQKYFQCGSSGADNGSKAFSHNLAPDGINWERTFMQKHFEYGKVRQAKADIIPINGRSYRLQPKVKRATASERAAFSRSSPNPA
jgi:hypothetical protein